MKKRETKKFALASLYTSVPDSNLVPKKIKYEFTMVSRTWIVPCMPLVYLGLFWPRPRGGRGQWRCSRRCPSVQGSVCFSCAAYERTFWNYLNSRPEAMFRVQDQEFRIQKQTALYGTTSPPYFLYALVHRKLLSVAQQVLPISCLHWCTANCTLSKQVLPISCLHWCTANWTLWHSKFCKLPSCFGAQQTALCGTASPVYCLSALYGTRSPTYFLSALVHRKLLSMAHQVPPISCLNWCTANCTQSKQVLPISCLHRCTENCSLWQTKFCLFPVCIGAQQTALYGTASPAYFLSVLVHSKLHSVAQ